MLPIYSLEYSQDCSAQPPKDQEFSPFTYLLEAINCEELKCGEIGLIPVALIKSYKMWEILEWKLIYIVVMQMIKFMLNFKLHFIKNNFNC